MSTEKRKIILDCDPGHDDAIAIVLAGLSEKIDLLAVTVVSGNQTLEKTANNALNVVEYLNLSVPVGKGMPRPLIKPRVVCDAIHGVSGLDGMDFPPHTQKFDDRNGIDLIIDTCLKTDKLTMVTTGPMTNLAMAIRLEPKILEHIDKIVLMGGSIQSGNVSPAAEFNILTDPEAAHICFTCGLPIYMVGLDVTRKVKVLPNVMERMKKLNTKCSKMFDLLMTVFNENQKKTFGHEGGPLHDPATIVSLIDESVITFTQMHVEIDLSRGPSYGRTNCGGTETEEKEKNCYVATEINVDKYWDVIEYILKKY